MSVNITNSLVNNNLINSKMIELRSRPDNPQYRERIFQRLIDPIFSEYYPQLDLANRQVSIWTAKMGGNGDIAMACSLFHLLKEQRPELFSGIFVRLSDFSKPEDVAKIFPSNLYPMEFVIDYAQAQKRKDELEQKAALIGIPTNAGEYHFYNKHHRLIHEYGLGGTGNTLSMGFKVTEEGIYVPKVSASSQIEAPWIAPFAEKGSASYHMYMQNWDFQLLGLLSVLNIEKNEVRPINLFMPIKFTINQLIEWKIIDTEKLKKLNIGVLERITPDGVQTVVIQDQGKRVRIFDGSVTKNDMEAIQNLSQPFFGCTGDLSFSEAVSLNKFPFYDVLSHKQSFVLSWARLTEEKKLSHFHGYLEQYYQFVRDLSAIYEEQNRKMPKGKGGWKVDVSWALSDPESVPRLTIGNLAAHIYSFAEVVAKEYAKPEMMKEVQMFHQHIRENYNVEKRLLSVVDRAVILKNHEPLIPFEKTLCQQFVNQEIGEEEAITQFRTKLEEVASCYQK